MFFKRSNVCVYVYVCPFISSSFLKDLFLFLSPTPFLSYYYFCILFPSVPFPFPVLSSLFSPFTGHHIEQNFLITSFICEVIFMFSVLHFKSKHVEHFMFLHYKIELNCFFVFPSVVCEASPWVSAHEARSHFHLWLVQFMFCGSPQMGMKGLTTSELILLTHI